MLLSLSALLPGSGALFAATSVANGPSRRLPPKAHPKAPARSYGAQVRKPIERTPDSGQWTKAAPGWTRVVRATDAGAGAYYAETLALVIDSQYLLVPWTFISDVWLSQPGARLYADGSRREAVLADVDLVSNLALLKLAETAMPTFYRTEIRLEAPAQEESLLVLSSRNGVRGGGRFLRAKTDGTFVRYQIAYDAGDMASVRYIFDRAGRLVAVSASSGGDENWSAPARAVYEMLGRQGGPRPASVTVSGQRRTQLFYWQDRWTRTLVPSRSVLSLQGLDCQTRIASIADRELASQIKSVRALECGEKFGLPIGAGYSAGMRISSGEAVLRSSDSGLSRKLAQALAADSLADFERASSLVNLLTVPECRDSGVTNRYGLSVQVKFCTSGLKFEPGLADTIVVVSAIDATDHASYAVARLRGFDQKNTKTVIESLVENVRGRK